MPELPEVETMVRGIRTQVEGGVLQGVRRMPCRCRPILIEPSITAINRRAAGQRVVQVRRRAKRVVLQLENGEGFAVEPRMTGLMLVADPPDRTHLRVEWLLQQGRSQRRVWFWDRRGLGTVRYLGAAQLRDLLEGGRLGRDALELTSLGWRNVLARTSRPIKVALLDQALVAGIGNLYASEILHHARIRPQTPAATLTAPRIERLHAAVQCVLHEAILHEGSTLGDGTYRNALNQTGSYQNAHRVYDREGETCFRCDGPIVRIVQAQRSTFYCPRCQR